MANQQHSTYWQADDKAVISKVFLVLGAFAVIMTVVAIGIGIVL